MRVLISFVGGTGHFLPTLPIARSLAARGHQVSYTCQGRMIEVVTQAGFAAFDSGGATLADPTARLPLAPTDLAAEVAVLHNSFAGRIAAERAPAMLAVAPGWGRT